MALTKDDLAFVLVPGSFSTPFIYEEVTSQLQARGYTVVQAPLPSAGDRHPLPPAGLHDDAAAIRAVLESTLATGKSAIPVLLSYGGVPGSEAVKDLTRGALGPGRPAVLHLVFLSALLFPEGMSVVEHTAEIAAAAAQPADTATTAPPETPAPTGPDPAPASDDPYMHLDPTTLPDLIYSDVPSADLRATYFAAMPPHSAASFAEKLAYAGWRDVPATYIVTAADRIVEPADQWRMIERADAVLAAEGRGRRFDTVVLEGSGHVAPLSRPGELVEVLARVAEKVLSA